MYENTYPSKRFSESLAFIQKHFPEPTSILDLGVRNPFSEILEKEGYQVINTSGVDLDIDRSELSLHQTKLTTALEIFEHLLSPFEVLRSIKSEYLIASVPLQLWFAKAYRNPSDERDQHFHEFEDWQFDWLLQKSGWEIIDRKKFTNPIKKLGIRPLLRSFTPRYYIVFCKRMNV